MSPVDNIKDIFERTTLMQRAMLLAVVITFIASSVMLTKWARTPDMRLLYNELSPEEAGKITEKVAEKGIAYELRSGGTSVYVPEDNVYQLRLDMAREGLPAGDQGGYKLFDNEKIGISPFVQSVNLNRALQDELSKSIQMIEGVVFARVHLVRPEQTLFGANSDKTTASVVLKLKPGSALSGSNIAAITHLVSGSVEGLKTENVTVVDSAGKLLSNYASKDAVASGANTALEYRERVEQTLSKKAQDMLALVLGPGRATVSVAAVLDMSSQNQTRETYDPQTKIATKEEIKNKSEIGASAAAQGGAAGNPSTTKDETITTEYVVGKTIEQKNEMPGEIVSLSVSAIVDLTPSDSNAATASADGGGTAKAAAGGMIMTVADVEEIIRNAVGLKSTDSLKVVNAKFYQAPTVETVDKEYQESVKWSRYTDIARQASLGLLAVSALLALKMFAGGKKQAASGGAVAAMGGAASPAGLLGAGQSQGFEPMMLRTQIASALQNNPEEVKKLFARWAQDKGS